ncbi:hypothetical protein FG379_002854 [Cryptosporidium bovis]|uniref:uncharacterized protein n=1 Tax=Cryptosporidium bovis TaxID=310047 RepID=UPI00351A4444|nr:hypothetical protein FG379_002854 [Cryptosporidium bovis]
MKIEANSIKTGSVTDRNDEYISEFELSKVRKAQNSAKDTGYSKINRCYSRRKALGRANNFSHGINCLKKVRDLSSSSSASFSPFLSSSITLPSIKNKKCNNKRLLLLSSSSQLSSPNSESNSNSNSLTSPTLISSSEDIKLEFGKYVKKTVNIGNADTQIDKKNDSGLKNEEINDNNNLSVVSSLESIEWSPEERVIITDTNVPISKSCFCSNWKRTINYQESPRTPQFRYRDNYSQFDLPFIGVSSDSETSSIGSGGYSYKYNSIDSFSNLCDNNNAELIIGITPHLYQSSSFSSAFSLSSSREYNNANNHYYTETFRDITHNNGAKIDNGVSELNIAGDSPFIPIQSNMIWRKTLDLLLSQWTEYFSRRHPFDSNDVENAIQFFIGLDNSTLNSITSSLIYVSHCARYSQIRKLNGNL